jgi:hypothetical protein
MGFLAAPREAVRMGGMSEQYPPGPPPRAMGYAPAQPDLPRPPGGSPPRAGYGAGWVAGIVLVSIWMALSLLFSAFLIPLGADATCNAATDSDACFDRLNVQLLVLMGIELAAVVGTIILWVRPRTRVWGFVLGILGTGVTAVAFSALIGIDL